MKTASFVVRRRERCGENTSQDSNRADPEFGLHLADDISASHP